MTLAIERPPRIRTKRVLSAFAVVAILALTLSMTLLFWVISDRSDRAARLRLDDLTRLVAARIEIQVDAAEPAFLSMANRASAMLAVDPPSPTTLADVRGQFNRFLGRTPATGVGVFNAAGDLVVEAGSDGGALTVHRPWRRLSPDRRRPIPDEAAPRFAFHDPVQAAGRSFLPISLPLDDPAIPNPGVASGGVIVFIVPTARIEGWFTGSLAGGGTVGGMLVNAENRIVAAFRPKDLPMVPEVGAILANLPQRSAVPLDGQVTLVETRAFFDTDAPGGREWLAGLSVVPNRDLRVVLLTRSGSIANLVTDAGWLLYAAALPPMILVLLFVYLVQNEWRKEDRRVDHLVSLSNRLRHATNLLHVGVVDWSVRSGDVVISAGWRRLLGYAPEEVANEIDEWHARLHPEDRDQAIRAYQDLADGRSTDLRHTVRLLHRDGRAVAVDERGGAQTDRRGRVTHVVLVQEPRVASGETTP